ncbi:hypothetical protein HPB47_002515 [Ixodes persulcatus]|uniref:Uncharacterized protein n=1 Tax=Ixodes persulcatus TaxID=34615 RepID=A0AC60PLE0_IXOPE|nr:hypothetical protein HPB47_002515 [Ixodes persulcatus]
MRLGSKPMSKLLCSTREVNQDCGSVSILRESVLYTDLEVLMNPKPVLLYGDPAYAHREPLQRPFGGASLTLFAQPSALSTTVPAAESA